MVDKIEKATIVLLVLLFAVAVGVVCGKWTAAHSLKDTISVRVDSVRDTLIVEHLDSVPVEREKQVLCYVEIPAPMLPDSVPEDSGTVTLPVVQKTYTDDSTYTAYVSGVDYMHWPRLDSIITRQRTVTNTITKTITIQKKRSRFSVGLQAGYGYGFQYRGLEPYVGIGVGYALFPP